VPRALWLVAAIVLAFPPLAAGWGVLVTGAFLGEFLSGGTWGPLSRITREASAFPLPTGNAAGPISADLYRPADSAGAPGLVLVHGLSSQGKDDPRVRQAARLLARTGWAVAVPTVEGLTVLRLRPHDAQIVVTAVRALEQAGHRPVAILAVSLGAGPALLAAAEPGASSSISAVLALGGYASAVELLRYTLTGAFGFGPVSGHRPVDESAIAQFVRANADLVGTAGQRLVGNRDPALVDDLVAGLPAETRQLLATLSPNRVTGQLRAPLVLIHGRDDPAVPFTESLRLAQAARAAGRPVRVVIVGSLGHVEPGQRASGLDLVRLGVAFYAFSRMSGQLAGAGSGS
jgi:fermentation-respiration switch protein FrsA (DUF1100 family)